jgi:hypothetical protein
MINDSKMCKVREQNPSKKQKVLTWQPSLIRNYLTQTLAMVLEDLQSSEKMKLANIWN